MRYLKHLPISSGTEAICHQAEDCSSRRSFVRERACLSVSSLMGTIVPKLSTAFDEAISLVDGLDFLLREVRQLAYFSNHHKI